MSGNLLEPVPHPGWESGIGERLGVHVLEGSGVEVAYGNRGGRSIRKHFPKARPEKHGSLLQVLESQRIL